MKLRIAWMALLGLAAIVLVGCGGGGGGGNNNPPPGGSVSLTAPTTSLTVGQTDQFAVKNSSGNAVTLPSSNFQFTSDNTAAVTVNSSGLATGVAVGMANIKATEVSTGKTASITIVVGTNSGAAVNSVTLTSASTTIAVGQTAQLTPVAKDAAGNILSLPAGNFMYVSNSPGVGTVSQAGLVTGVANGVVGITVTETVSGKTGSLNITVGSVATVATVTLTSPSNTINLGQTVQLTATAKDASGNTLNIPAANFQYTSATPTIATVSASGLVTAKCPGTVNISVKETTSNVGNTLPITVPGGLGPHVIVFDSNLNGVVINGNKNFDIYTFNLDTNQTTQLTNKAGAANAPDGTNANPALSPDGRFIVFQSSRSGSNQIWSMNQDGTSPTQLSNNPAASDSFHPRWSPDNSKIIYASSAGKTGGLSTNGADLYIYNVAAGTNTRLTNLPDNFSNFDPEFSPDGSKILFTTDRDGNPEVYVMNADLSGSVTNLTHNAATDFAAVWSPDGSKIAFVSDRTGTRQIWLMNSDGTGTATQLTQDAVGATQPGFLADGSLVYASGRAGGTNKIYQIKDVANPQGTLQPVTTGTSNDRSPRGRLCP